MIDAVALTWCASSIVVLTIAAVGVWDGIHDLRALRTISNGRQKVAWMHLRNQSGRLAIGIGWTWLGVPRLFDEAVVPLSEGVAILIATNIILAVMSGLDLRTRHQLLETA